MKRLLAYGTEHRGESWLVPKTIDCGGCHSRVPALSIHWSDDEYGIMFEDVAFEEGDDGELVKVSDPYDVPLCGLCFEAIEGTKDGILWNLVVPAVMDGFTLTMRELARIVWEQRRPLSVEYVDWMDT